MAAVSKSKAARRGRSGRGKPTALSHSVFSERLKRVMAERGLTVTEVASRMRQHLPEGETFATSNLSHYRQGRSVPREGHLRALSLALGVDPSELAPPTEAESMADAPSRAARQHRARAADDAAPVIRAEDFGAEMRLVIDQRVPWKQALQILEVLKAPREA